MDFIACCMAIFIKFADTCLIHFYLVMNNVNQDELILKQQEAIQKDIADNTKLVSDLLPLQSLETEFQSDDVFKSKILQLGQKYSQMRRVRPDGNCFFRAVGYRLFEVVTFLRSATLSKSFFRGCWRTARSGRG